MSEQSRRPRIEEMGTTVRQPGEPVSHGILDYPSTTKAEAEEMFKKNMAALKKAVNDASRIDTIIYSRT